jgi:ADP-glucose pyrophosphorylase
VGPGSILGADVHIGAKAQVAHSIVLDGARVEPHESIEHMLVGKKARLSLRTPPA